MPFRLIFYFLENKRKAINFKFWDNLKKKTLSINHSFGFSSAYLILKFFVYTQNLTQLVKRYVILSTNITFYDSSNAYPIKDFCIHVVWNVHKYLLYGTIWTRMLYGFYFYFIVSLSHFCNVWTFAIHSNAFIHYSIAVSNAQCMFDIQ